MSEETSHPQSRAPDIGEFVWFDLSAGPAAELAEFYCGVVGWKKEAVSVGGYQDFTMLTSDATPAAGVCHARGANSKLPPMWIPYITVASVDESIATCLERGGSIVDGPRQMGGSNVCVLKDPVGAVFAVAE